MEGSLMVTSTFDTTAPVGSVTSPRTDVVAVCAWPVVAKVASRRSRRERRPALTEAPDNFNPMYLTVSTQLITASWNLEAQTDLRAPSPRDTRTRRRI